jgi:peptidoglycan/LPS O-acetylase OafA/YrhL
MTESHHVNDAAIPRSEGHWPFLDLLRFGAALLVLFGHTRGLVFTSIQNVPQPGVGTKIFYFISGSHREGVAIFFVVSGFLVGGTAWRSIREKRFEAKSYLASRFSRIYLVLIPAIALAILLDWAGRSFLGETRFYSERPLMPLGFNSDWTWPQMACNLASLQGIFCEPLGMNLPLWSLGFEWVFYLFSPILFIITLARVPILVKAGAVALLFLGLHYFAGPLVRWLPLLMIWLAGAMAAKISRQRDLPLVLGLAGLTAVMVGFLLSRMQVVPIYGTDLIVGLGTALAVANKRLLRWGLFGRPIRIAADFSYSLYLIHIPVTVFLGGVIEHFGWPSRLVAPGVPAYAVFAGLVAASLVLAALYAQATERHTSRVRQLLLGRRSLKTVTVPRLV